MEETLPNWYLCSQVNLYPDILSPLDGRVTLGHSISEPQLFFCRKDTVTSVSSCVVRIK